MKLEWGGVEWRYIVLRCNAYSDSLGGIISELLLCFTLGLLICIIRFSLLLLVIIFFFGVHEQWTEWTNKFQVEAGDVNLYHWIIELCNTCSLRSLWYNYKVPHYVNQELLWYVMIWMMQKKSKKRGKICGIWKIKIFPGTFCFFLATPFWNAFSYGGFFHMQVPIINSEN